MVLQLVNGFRGPVLPGHMKIPVDQGAVFPIGREMANRQVAKVLFVPQLMPRAVLKVEWIVLAGDFERPVA